MLATPDGHPFRKIYSVLRRLPILGWAWRSLSGDGRWRDVGHYAAAGGAFAGHHVRPGASAVPTFGSEIYFHDLVDRIVATRAPLNAVADRIVLVNNGLSAGGAERQIVYTLTGLDALGYDVRFIGEFIGRAPGLDFYAEALVGKGIPIEEFERRVEPGDRLYAGVSRAVAESLAEAPIDFMLEILDMAAMLRRLKPQVVHLWQDETSTKYGIAALIAGVSRIVLSGRNLNPTYFSFHQPFMRGAYRALQSAPGVRMTNNTQAGARSYADWLGIDVEQIGVIQNAFDFSCFSQNGANERSAIRSRLGISDNDRLIVGVFRFSPEKRPDLWIDSAACVLKQRPGLRFIVAGSGAMEADLRTRVQTMGLAKQIHLIGETSDVASLYSAADVFFLTSSEEGAPNVLIEAQWAGLPCVVTDAGGVAETVRDGETAIVTSVPTVSSLAAALLLALDDVDFQTRARHKGPEFVSERFGLSRMIRDTLLAYEFEK